MCPGETTWTPIIQGFKGLGFKGLGFRGKIIAQNLKNSLKGKYFTYFWVQVDVAPLKGYVAIIAILDQSDHKLENRVCRVV